KSKFHAEILLRMYSERRKRYTSITPFLPSENKRLSVCNIEQHSLQIDNNMHLQDTIYYVRQ
ncbi:hypothetical protein DQF27_13035, partial [Escherichia coli]|nr:hypothetical protein [Escherichia coli]